MGGKSLEYSHFSSSAYGEFSYYILKQISKNNSNYLIYFIFCLFLIFVIKELFISISRFSEYYLENKIQHKIRNKVFYSSIGKRIEPSDLTYRIYKDVESIILMYKTILLNSWKIVVLFFSVFYALYGFGKEIFLISVACVPLFLLLYGWIGHYMRKYDIRNREQESNLFLKINELSKIKDDEKEKISNRFFYVSKNVLNKRMVSNFFKNLFGYANEVSSYFFVIIITYILCTKVQSNLLTVGQFTAFLVYVNKLSWAYRALGGLWSNLQIIIVGSSRALQIIDHKD